jgi:hypothetical protein
MLLYILLSPSRQTLELNLKLRHTAYFRELFQLTLIILSFYAIPFEKFN